MNGIVGEADEMNKETPPKARIPNRDGFVSRWPEKHRSRAKGNARARLRRPARKFPFLNDIERFFPFRRVLESNSPESVD
jgi:hypothetical protein